MPKKVEGLEQLLAEELQDLFDAEKQLVKALPKMAKGATDDELENALREHLEVTKQQVARLEEVFQAMDMKARSRPCRGMKGIVEEGQEILEENMGVSLLDSAITGAARKVEHYEMAGYESARSIAQMLGMREAAELLQQTLQEEMQADRQLAQISKRLVKEASRASAESGQAEAGKGRQAKSAGRGGAGSRSATTSRGATARGNSGARGRGSRGGQKSEGGHAARPLTDHEEIRQWAEERGASPACVRGTGGKGDVGMLRLDFPGWSGEESLEHIAWDEWFERFDERNLALMVQDTTAGGETSNFNKLVSRQSAAQKPRTRTAR